MQTPPIPLHETERLAALRGFAVLDTPAEADFDRFTRLAARLFDVPIALVSLVDAERQWFKSDFGLGATQTSREVSFCGHALVEVAPLVVPNALEDPRFADNPLVLGDPHIRFYAGAPLRTSDGYALGTLCVIDRRPRELTTAQRDLLAELGNLVMEQLEHRRSRLMALRESEQLRALLTALPAPVTVHLGEKVVFANEAAERVMRVSPGALVGHTAREFVVPGSRSADSSPSRIERKLRTGDGGEVRVESTPMPLRWHGEDAWAVVHRDVGAERETQALRRRESERLARQLEELLAVFDELPEGVVVFDAELRVAYANRSVAELFAVDRATLPGWYVDDIARHVATMSDEPERVLSRMKQMLSLTEGQSQAAQFTFSRPRHRVMRRELHKLGLVDRPWVSVWTDVTEEVAQLKQSQAAASTDALTKLPNRRAAETELEVALAAGGPVTVVLFDVDHFKKVNDTFGHDVGDEVLIRVGEALRTSARTGDFVSRWGGEEFLAVVRADDTGARRFAERVRLAVSSLETSAGKVTISGGLATVARPADVKLADAQLYEAKRQGRNRVMG